MTYSVRRIGQAIIVLLATFTFAYVLLAALPGDAVEARFANPELGLSAEQIAEIRASYGADEPIILRYFTSLGGFLTGDFGFSVQTGTAVKTLIAQALPGTLLVAFLALLLGGVVAFLIGIVATFAPLSWIRPWLRNLPPLLVSVPTFWIGIVLIQLISFKMGWVPIVGASSTQQLILPVITLSMPVAAPIAQVLVRSIDEVVERPFVMVVRARGASPRWILWKNVLRNALLPTLTIAGVTFGELVGGAVVTEAVFGRTGLGHLTVQAVANRDTPVLMAIVVIAATVFVLINLLIDLLYPVLDPRLRKET